MGRPKKITNMSNENKGNKHIADGHSSIVKFHPPNPRQGVTSEFALSIEKNEAQIKSMAQNEAAILKERRLSSSSSSSSCSTGSSSSSSSTSSLSSNQTGFNNPLSNEQTSLNWKDDQ